MRLGRGFAVETDKIKGLAEAAAAMLETNNAAAARLILSGLLAKSNYCVRARRRSGKQSERELKSGGKTVPSHKSWRQVVASLRRRSPGRNEPLRRHRPHLPGDRLRHLVEILTGGDRLTTNDRPGGGPGHRLRPGHRAGTGSGRRSPGHLPGDQQRNTWDRPVNIFFIL